jgi:hypothetical protein
MASKNLVLRTVYIDPEVDDLLRNEAFAGRTSKNDLFRKYLSLGMEAARKASKPAVQDSAKADAAARKVAPKKKPAAGATAKAR